MARRATQTDRRNAQNIHSAAGYHRSSFKSLKYFTSDRFEELNRSFQRKNGQPVKGYGIELELTSVLPEQRALCSILQELIFKAEFHEDLFRQENDCSLGGASSVECVSQIMTKEAIRNFYPGFKRMFNEHFPAFGIKADNSCGMHVNISNALLGKDEEAQAETAKKLLYIINKHYAVMAVMLHRDRRATMYCARMEQYTDKEACKNADLHYMSGSHGNCCNWSHFPEGRIELRLVGPSQTYANFRNTMETVFHLVAASKKLSWADLDSIEKIFSGCNYHVLNRFADVVTANLCTMETYEAIKAKANTEERFL